MPRGIGEQLARAYSDFRASWTYLLFLAGYIALWLTLHWVFNWDKDLSEYNSFLSTDASVAFTVFTIEAARAEIRRRREERKREAARARQEAINQALLESMHDMIEAVMEAVGARRLRD